MQLEQIVPFGRSLQEYIHMFDLTPAELQLRLLGVGDGPASFNAELTSIGGCVVSVDPVYQFPSVEIRRRFDAVVDDIIAQVAANHADYNWSYHASPSSLRAARVEAMNIFLADYERARSKELSRYVDAGLPALPFADGSFDLAVCSHLLFLYSEHLDGEFHVRALMEMLRVAHEVRVFPLLDLKLVRSVHLPRVFAELSAAGYKVAVQKVPYEMQRGGNEMLRIVR
jgi:SAM-dependent methyltransferase